jgi:ferredoxin
VGQNERNNEMKAIVDEETCTGCGLCEEVCPEVFELVAKVAKVKVNTVPDEHEDTCQEAADSCPVEAISIEN